MFRAMYSYLQKFMSSLCFVDVLGSARTGLIFTGIQEGNPGRDTAGRADPTWPNRAGYSIPCAAMLGSGGGERGGRNSLAAWERTVAAVRENGSPGRAVCVVFSPFSVSLLFLFPLFAVLLNCCYPDPPVSSCFFPFSSAPQQGEGQPRGAFVAGCSPTRTVDQCKDPRKEIYRLDTKYAKKFLSSRANFKKLFSHLPNPDLLIKNFICVRKTV